MPAVTSADGTRIAYESAGTGPALVLVDGATTYRAAGPMRPLAAALVDSFTVYAYDRRGRGDSSDTTPYAVGREVDDLQAVIAQAGGGAFVFGMSSGGALALRAAAATPAVRKVAVYEPPFLADVDGNPWASGYSEQLVELLAAGRNSDAVALFMTSVGLPPQAIEGMRGQPGWAAFEAIAPTLAYDDQVLAGGHVPSELAATLAIPVLVLSGSASPHGLQQAAKLTAGGLPTAQLRTLDGQTHHLVPDIVGPVLVDFFGG